MTMTPEEKLAMARDDDTYAIGFQDGYEKAVQDIDLRTGGDGEYFASTLPGRGCPDAGTMICRIVDRMQERVRAETGWQDIATAPKDGTLIDVWRGGEFPRRVPDVSWREPTDSEWWVHGGDTIRTPAATWHDMFGPFGKDDTPTHWRPLPPPPAIRETPHAEG